jgi:type IV pilus assembly protein PilO
MGRTQKEKMWLSAAGVTAVIVLMVGWFLLIAPQRDRTSRTNEQIATAQLENDIDQQKVVALASQNDNLADYRRQLERAHLALPADSGLPELLRSMQQIGDATSTDVVSVSVGDPTPAASATPAAETPTATASASAAPTTATSGVLPETVFALPITAQVEGSMPQLREFLTQLQKVQPRALLIQQATYQTAAGTAGGTGQLGLTLQAFVEPPSATSAPTTASPTPTAGG